jgi:hypothetical protein
MKLLVRVRPPMLLWFAVLGSIGCGAVARSQAAETLPVTITSFEDGFHVKLGEDAFCSIDHQNYEKPIVFPIYGPGQIPMTRSYPMQKDVPGEATDHPHHKSMWFGHGDVNGISFWHGEGKMVTESANLAEREDGHSAVELQNRLVGPDGTVVARETMEFQFGGNPEARWIDWTITLHASEGDLRLGDTKEGTAAVRVHPNLRLSNDPQQGVTTANGTAINSNGTSGKEVWGKSAKWVDYSGQVDGQTVGIAFFDHPSSFRHPTHWHARDYGLFAANPFGLSHFEGGGADGSHALAHGESLTFRYRIVFHRGNVEEANVGEMYENYTNPTP